MTQRKRHALACILLTTILVLGLVAARLLCPKINLPLHNPWHVTGTASLMNFNPSTNRAQYACVLLLPCALLLLLYFLPFRGLKELCFRRESPVESSAKPRRVSRGTWIALTLSLVAVFGAFSLVIPTEIASGPFDPFHEGEALGPATAYMHGQVIYKDFLVGHGFVQDVGRCVLAFRLFGRSIAAARTFWSIVKVSTFLLMAVFLVIALEGAYARAFGAGIVLLISMLPLLPVYENGLEPIVRVIGRDITSFTFLICMLLLQKYVSRGSRCIVLAAAASFIAVGSLAFSVDSGSYLSLSYALLWPMLYFAYVRHKPIRQQVLNYVLPSALGLVAGVVVLGIVTQWHIVSFARFAFLILPKYFPLMDGVPYSTDRIIPFLAMAVVAANTFWVMLKYFQHRTSAAPESNWQSFVSAYFAEILLAVVGAIMFLSALGISDEGHITIYLLTSYVLSIVIIARHVRLLPLRAVGLRRASGIVIGLSVAILLCWTINRVSSDSLIAENFPLGTPDTDYIPPDQVATLDFLRENLGPKESFLTLTSEGSWYYFLDKPSPVKFSMVYWAATDFYQREAIRDIERGNVKYLIVVNNNWCNAVQGIPTHKRLPILVSYLQSKYAPRARIDGNWVFVRKT